MGVGVGGGGRMTESITSQCIYELHKVKTAWGNKGTVTGVWSGWTTHPPVTPHGVGREEECRDKKKKNKKKRQKNI